MQSLMQPIQVKEKTPGATRGVFGLTIPTDAVFQVPTPMLGALAENGVEINFVTRGTHDLPFPSPRVTRFIWSKLSRYELGAAKLSAEQIARRRAALVAFLESPPSVPAEHAAFVVGHTAHYALGGLAMSVDDALAVTLERMPSLEASDVARWFLAAIEGGAFYAYNSVGRDLDSRAEQAREAAEKNAAQDAAVTADLAAPNTKTLDDYGVIAIEVGPGAQVPAPIQAVMNASCVKAGDRWYTALPSELFAGAHLPADTIAPGVELVDGSFVLPMTSQNAVALVASAKQAAFDGARPRPHALRFVEWMLTHARPQLGIATDAPRTTEWDETTVDGRHRVELFERILEAHKGAFPSEMPSINAGEWPKFDFHLRFLFEAGARGLSLADDVTASVLMRAIRKHWDALCAEWKNAHDARETERHADWTSSWGKDARAKEYVPKTFAKPKLYPWCESDEALLSAYRAHSSGKASLFGVDELYTSPDPSILDRVRDVLRFGDPWAARIKAFVATKKMVRQTELEVMLVEAKEISSFLTTPQHKRIARVMIGLGWTKTERVVDGRKTRVWLKTPGAEKWT